MKQPSKLSVRDAVSSDLPALQALLGRRIELPLLAHERLFVAVAEAQAEAESAAANLLATLRLRPAIGLALPRWWYHVGCAVHAAAELALFHRQPTLLMCNDLTGTAELCDINAAAPAQALSALVRAALDAVDAQAAVYGPTVIAELPGTRDGNGDSPFWQGLGRHFYSQDPHHALAQHGPAWRSHVAALLPRHPIYTSFLPGAAQAAIGQNHAEVATLRGVLESCGLAARTHVAIDDAGPVLERHRPA